jgi:CelD/BcsL family acetyltransferase involved in cellulose biosynthesis
VGPVQRGLSDGLAGLEALRPEWERLWHRCPDASSFLRPQWLIPWARHFAPDTCFAATARQDGRLTGVLPMFAHLRDGRRVLSLIGAGLSDTLDVLAEPEDAGATVVALLAEVAAGGRFWDTIELQDLPAGSRVLTALSDASLDIAITPEQPHPVVALPETTEALEAALPDRFRANLQYARRRAAADGQVRYVRAEASTLDEWMEALFRLHSARWRARGGDGVLADARVRRFHLEAARGLLAAGALRLFGLLVGDRVAGVYYGLCERGRACYYLGGFDPEQGRLSPGTLVLAYAIGDAIREGARVFDFLRGREPYKYTWGARDQPYVKGSIACAAPRAPELAAAASAGSSAWRNQRSSTTDRVSQADRKS